MTREQIIQAMCIISDASNLAYTSVGPESVTGQGLDWVYAMLGNELDKHYDKEKL